MKQPKITPKKKTKSTIKKKSSTPKKVPQPTLPIDALRCLKYRISNEYDCERHMFIKKDLSKDNSIIVTNIPSFLGEKIVEAIINSFVPFDIEETVVQRSNASDGSLSQGHLTMAISFIKEEAVMHALNNVPETVINVSSLTEEFNFPSVLHDAYSLYAKLFPDESDIEEMAKTYVERYDIELAEARREAKRKYSEPDEDGWITVHGKKKAGKVVKLKRDEVPLVGGLLNPKKQKLDLAFYRFEEKKDRQKRELELLRKFEEDKKRIARLKESRTFKP